jgi:hypothetical protein
MKTTTIDQLVIREVTSGDAIPFDELGDWRAIATVSSAPDWDEPEDWLKVRGSWPFAACYIRLLGTSLFLSRTGLMTVQEWDRAISDIPLISEATP